MFAILAASETVRAQGNQAARQPRSNLIGDNLHVIGGRDDRSFDAFQRFQQVRPAFRLGWMEPVPALDLQRVAAQLVVAGYAPDIRLNLVLLRQDLLRAQSFIEDGAAAEQMS